MKNVLFYSDKLKSQEAGMLKNEEAGKPMFGKPMAIDIGTTNTQIYICGEGLVLDEPSVVAYEKYSKRILASGREAKRYLGKTPQNLEVTRPLRGGYVSDFDIVKAMIREFLLKVQKKKRFFKSKLCISVPVNISSAEKKVFFQAAKSCGMGKIYFLEEPLAAALGAGLSIKRKKGQMVLDIGGGSVEISVVSVSGVAYSDIKKIGGDAINEAIASYLLETQKLQVGENRAERCKIEAANVFQVNGNTTSISGKDIETYIPKEIILDKKEILRAIEKPLGDLIIMIKEALEKTPKELVSDIKEDGIYLTGGGSLLKGLPEFIEREVNVCCHLQKDPYHTVIKGAAIAMENRRKFKKVLIKR